MPGNYRLMWRRDPSFIDILQLLHVHVEIEAQVRHLRRVLWLRSSRVGKAMHDNVL